jgi:hypothetical protein
MSDNFNYLVDDQDLRIIKNILEEGGYRVKAKKGHNYNF